MLSFTHRTAPALKHTGSLLLPVRPPHSHTGDGFHSHPFTSASLSRMAPPPNPDCSKDVDKPHVASHREELGDIAELMGGHRDGPSPHLCSYTDANTNISAHHHRGYNRKRQLGAEGHFISSCILVLESDGGMGYRSQYPCWI